MQFLLAAEQTEGIDQAYQSKIMISVQVGNENVRYPAAPDLIIDHLYLRAFAAIYEEVFSTHGDYLAGGMSVKCRNSRIISKDSYREHVQSKAKRLVAR